MGMVLATDYTEKAVIKSCWSGDTTTGMELATDYTDFTEKISGKKLLV